MARETLLADNRKEARLEYSAYIPVEKDILINHVPPKETIVMAFSLETPDKEADKMIASLFLKFKNHQHAIDYFEEVLRRVEASRDASQDQP